MRRVEIYLDIPEPNLKSFKDWFDRDIARFAGWMAINYGNNAEKEME